MITDPIEIERVLRAECNDPLTVARWGEQLERCSEVFEVWRQYLHCAEPELRYTHVLHGGAPLAQLWLRWRGDMHAIVSSQCDDAPPGYVRLESWDSREPLYARAPLIVAELRRLAVARARLEGRTL